MAKDGPWKEDEVRKTVANPIYAGVGPYPALISDDDWIATAKKLIKERGSDSFLRDLLANLREAFPKR